MRRSDSGLHVLLGRLGDLEECLFGIRRDDLQSSALGGFDPATADVELLRVADLDVRKCVRSVRYGRVL